MMNHDFDDFQFEELKLFALQFETGARRAASDGAITVVIDVFRASNTMLQLLDAGARVKPVKTVKEALNSEFDDYIRVGEEEGDKISQFEYDNSPVLISNNKEEFYAKDVVIRTTNGTRGILAAMGSSEIIVGTFQNFTAVSNYCHKKLKEGIPVAFVAMGTWKMARIEDDHCAKMFVICMLEKLERDNEVQTLTRVGKNPWNRDWRAEIMNVRGGTYKEEDYLFCLQLDTLDLVPRYNASTGFVDI